MNTIVYRATHEITIDRMAEGFIVGQNRHVHNASP